MAVKQGFPQLDAPMLNTDGSLTLVWWRFFVALWNRTGASDGNNAATFNYPATDGNISQVLTSQGTGKATIWTTILTKLSQFTNDAGFITNASISNFTTSADTHNQISDFVLAQESSVVPLPNATAGSVGTSTKLTREDHVHPRETGPTYSGTVTATRFTNTVTTWTTGTGAPSGVMPNASLYSRTDGGAGTRLYVSNGATWASVAGV